MENNEAGTSPKPARTRRCPLCKHESWRISYGLAVFDAQERYPKVEFAGCVPAFVDQLDPKTGTIEIVSPAWACQNPECRHRWL